MNIDKLEYWEIKGKNETPKKNSVSYEGKNCITKDLIQATKHGLIQLIIYFSDENNPYIASDKTGDKFNKKGQDYHHLSRSEEWRE